MPVSTDRHDAPPDPAHLRHAIHLAVRNVVEGVGGPFGAVVVRDGLVVGTGTNRVTADCDPTAHAEVVAIRDACRRLATFSLAGCELYASCEPCPLCLAATYWARIDRVWFAADGDDAAAAGFDDRRFAEELSLPPGERSLVLTRLLADEAAPPFEAWAKRPDLPRY